MTEGAETTIKLKAIRRIHSRMGYRDIIEVLVPTRFYWNADGSFDGIELGPLSGTTKQTKHQVRLMHYLLNKIGHLVELDRSNGTEVPEVFLKAFGEDK